MIILYPLGSGRDPERLTWIRSCVRGGTFFKHPPYWDKPIGTLLNILHFCIYRGLKITLEKSNDGWKFKMIVRSRVKTNCFCVVDMNKQNVWVWIFFNNQAKTKEDFCGLKVTSSFCLKTNDKDSKEGFKPDFKRSVGSDLTTEFYKFNSVTPFELRNSTVHCPWSLLGPARTYE